MRVAKLASLSRTPHVVPKVLKTLPNLVCVTLLNCGFSLQLCAILRNFRLLKYHLAAWKLFAHSPAVKLKLPRKRGQGHLRLTREGDGRIVLRRNRVEIGNSSLRLVVKCRRDINQRS
jgi:hypothetical protein